MDHETPIGAIRIPCDAEKPEGQELEYLALNEALELINHLRLWIRIIAVLHPPVAEMSRLMPFIEYTLK